MSTKDRGPRKGASAFQGLETRACLVGELRAADGEDGVIEGYVAKWGEVDSYGSVFERGCFAKTLQERGKRVRVVWNHGEEVIGVPLELREDDTGLFCRLKLVLSVQRAREVFDLAKAGAIDAFSFGFKTIREAWIEGVRRIKEVALYEVSPVIFPANENAQITGVRNMPNPTEFRAEDFAESYADAELNRRGYLLMDVLHWTLSDIWWKSDARDPEMVQAKIADCLAKFSAAYAQYAAEVTATWAGATEARAMPDTNDLARAVRAHLITGDNSPERVAASTSLTLAEVRSLSQGGIGLAQSKLAELPEEVRKAYAKRRAEVLEQTCSELRAGTLAPAERSRLAGLLGIAPEEPPAASDADMQAVLRQLSEFREALGA